MRIAIITDIHENIINLKQAFNKIDKSNCDEVICLGDISGYSIPYYDYLDTRNAHKCLALVKERCKYIVIGNHDMHAAQIIPKICKAFDFPENWYQLDYQKRKAISNGSIWLHEENELNPLYSYDDIQFLRTLSEIEIMDIGKGKVLFSHYVFPNLSGFSRKVIYTFADEFAHHFKWMEEQNSKISFTGHTHVKGFYVVNKKKFKQYNYKKVALNDEAVCVGIPSISGKKDRRGFCIFDSEEMTVEAIRI
jgi:predicted phosphodiesterase